MFRLIKFLLSLVSGLLTLLIIAGFVLGNYFYNLALNPDYDKSGVLNAEHNEVDYSGMQQSFDAGRAWFDQSGYTETELKSYDGLWLNAYSVLNAEPDKSWVIICHGYNGSAYSMVGFAQAFYQMGFNVLMPDARGCGNSGGDYIGMGWHDRLDLLGWIDELNARYGPANIVLYGISMGGATVMMAGGEELPGNVRAIVEDSGYTSAWEEFAYQLKSLYGLPAFPLMYFASAVTRVRAGYWLGDADTLGQLAKNTTPMLFIHGDADTFVPAAMLDTVHAAGGGEKEKLLVAGAGHAGGATADPALYWGTVQAFLTRYLV